MVALSWIFSWIPITIYEPTLVNGRSYFPTPNETWTAFTADADSIARLNSRKALLRQHVADICLAFSEPTYWRESAESVADRSDGQSMIRKWTLLFHDESITSLSARADKLKRREHNIVGAENPSEKLQYVITEWAAIRLTQFGMEQYSPSWLANTLLGMVTYNSHFAIWRQSGGSSLLLRETNPAKMQSIIMDIWSDNHFEWERTERETAKKRRHDDGSGGGARNNRSRVGAGNGDGTDRGRDMSTVNCYNCGKYGHYARDCRSKGGKGGKGGGKGGKGGKGRQGKLKDKLKSRSSWLKPPCQYKGCDGDRSTHSTVDCPSKLENDKNSLANNPNARARKGKGAKTKPSGSKDRRVVTYGDDSILTFDKDQERSDSESG